MKESFKGIKQRLLTGYGIAATSLFLIVAVSFTTNIISRTNVWDLLAAATSSFSGGASTTLFFTPYGDETITPGDTTSIDINVNSKVPINAIGATISFSSSTLEIVGISKQKSLFDLWTEDTSISEDSGEIHFSGGTTLLGGITGTGTLLTITVRAKGNGGKSQLTFSAVQAFPSDGTGKAIITDARSITYNILAMTRLGVISTEGGASTGPSKASPDLNNDGSINLIDISILAVKMIGAYDPRYDLNQDGFVNLGDLSALLSNLGH